MRASSKAARVRVGAGRIARGATRCDGNLSNAYINTVNMVLALALKAELNG